MFEPQKLFTVGLAVLLLAPIGIVFWRIAVHEPWPEDERRARLQAALQEHALRIGTTNEDGSVVAAVAVKAQEAIGFSRRTDSWLSFYPRRWVGIVGLLTVVAALVCFLLSLFVPVSSELSMPPQ